jgi:hypothetical protein
MLAIRWFYLLIASLLVSWLCPAATAQSNARIKTFHHLADTLIIDTLPMVPGSVVIAHHQTLLPDSHYQVIYHTSKIIFSQPLPDEITVQYQVFTFAWEKDFHHKDRKKIEPINTAFGNPFEYTPSSANRDVIDKQGLDMRGSVSRGFGLGNNQDLVVNSNLNLQVSGKLNNDIDVLAAISDDNNPIQPEGNTQQLQDFDRVYIQFGKKATHITLGDFEMKRPPGTYFLNYNKKSRGVNLAWGKQVSKKVYTTFTGDGAVSRGRFARNLMDGQEGNQGPYRLKGNNGEIFIIIISGTEAVYLDGEKMLRGEQNDYVINYNTGEVVFTPRRLITRYSRIIIEFQYSDRNYARSVFRLSNEWKLSSKTTLNFNYFSEQDNKNQPFQRLLSDEEKNILGSVGNQLSKAVISTETAVPTFDPTKLLYTKIDTVVNSVSYIAYKYTSDANDTNLYILSFSNVGEGNGNYIIGNSAANGRVYVWVAPIGGKKQGAYEPITQLISPKRMQMFTAGMNWQADSFTLFQMDFSRSNYNRNTFSEINKENDAGLGIRAAGKTSKVLSGKRDQGWLLNAAADYEFVDRKFRYVERYRNVEFDRQWNRKLQNEATIDTGYNEHITNIDLAVVKPRLLLVRYKLGSYTRNNIYTGLSQRANLAFTYKKWEMEGEGSALGILSKANTLVAPENRVRGYKSSIAYLFKPVKLYISTEGENSDFTSKKLDSLLAGSYHYTQYSGGVQSSDSIKVKFNANYTFRKDELPLEGGYQYSTKGDILNLGLDYTSQQGNRVKLTGTYRNLSVNKTLTSQQAENTILFRLEYDFSMLKRMFSFNTFYQVGNGQELKRQYSYVEVQPGNGIYQWNDYNKDSIQQLNEFEVAVFKDKARFIRIYLPTNEYVRSSSNQLNLTVNWNPMLAWKNKKKVLKFFSKFNNTTAFKIERQTIYDQNITNALNPFIIQVSDTSLLSLTSFIRSTLYFNRSSPVWGADINYQDNRGKQLLTNGLDSRTKTEWGLNVRYNLSTSLSIQMMTSKGSKGYASQYFEVRNYLYNYSELKPRINWQYKTKLRFTLLYNFMVAQNSIGLLEKTTNHETGLEFKYNFKENGTLNARYSLNKINYTGNVNSPIAFEMLNGLLNGNNQLWNINIQQRIAKNTQITVSYDGRKNESSKVIHIGRVEARYIF